MKTFLAILFSLFSTFLFCQNWEILNPEVTYYYSHSDSVHLTNTIHIDSVITDDLDQTFYMSNKYKVCDTCDFDPMYEVIIYRYAKEFLGFNTVFDAENNVYVIEGDSLFAQAESGDFWQFNSEISATVSNVYADVVIGELDSLKIISLSSNDTIILSKNHGIIRYPDFESQGKYYELKGYHNNEWYYGEVFPNFWSIYDFAVGDEYCGYYGSAYMNFYISKKQIQILSLISISADEILYEVTARGSHTSGAFDINDSGGWSETSYYNSGNTTLTFYRYSGQYEDFFGNKEIGNPQEIEGFFLPYFQNFSGFNECLCPANYAVVKNEYNPESGYQKSVRNFSTYGDSLLFGIVVEGGDSYLITYGNSLGRTFAGGISGFGSYEEGLQGAVINGDTIGNFCNFPFDLGIENLEITPLSIHPNPATTQITLQGKYNSLEIYSQTGQLVLKNDNPAAIIDISHLSAGIYMVKAFGDGKLYVTSLMVEW